MGKRVSPEDIEMMKALKARGLTQKAISNALGIPQSTVGWYVGQKGVRKPERKSEAEAVRDLFTVAADPARAEKLIEKVQDMTFEYMIRLTDLIKEELAK